MLIVATLPINPQYVWAWAPMLLIGGTLMLWPNKKRP